MSSIRDQLLTQLVVELNASRPGNVPEFERVNNRPRDTTQVPANVIYPSREGITPVHNRRGPLVSRTLTLRVEMRAVGGDTSVDPSLVWATRILAPSNLNRLCHDIQEDAVSWAFRRRAKPYCLCVLDLTINYSTNRADQEQVS